MLDYNSKIGILMTRLALLDEVVADSGMKMAILRTTDGDVAFFVVTAENLDEIVFQYTVERARLSAEEPADIAGAIVDELFALLAQYDEAREEAQHGA